MDHDKKNSGTHIMMSTEGVCTSQREAMGDIDLLWGFGPFPVLVYFLITCYGSM